MALAAIDGLVSGDRARWFYFTERGRHAVLNVIELAVLDGQLVPGDPSQPTYMDLKAEREEEK